MESFDFGNIAQQLDQTKEEGITFEDKQQSWDKEDDVKDVVEALEKQKVVHYLKLEGNTLGVDAAKAIGEALKRHPEFRKALWRNMFTRRLKSEIPQALKFLGQGLMAANAHLQVLDLSDNALGPNGMVGLEDLLRSPVCYSLQELRLNNCGLGIGGGRMLAKALLDCRERSIADGKPLQLKIFIAGRNRLENDGAIAIAHMLGTLGTLEEIIMPQNSIFHVGIKALAEAFMKNPRLRVINLNDNIVTHKGAEALADALSSILNLQELNLGDCLLKSRGAYFIADVLDDKHGLLESVDLSYNEIGMNAGVGVANALQNKQYLKSVNLDGNQFGKQGCDQIKDIMNASQNPSALAKFEEDQSEEEGEEGDDDDDDDENDESEVDETVSEEDAESYEGGEDDDYADEDENEQDYIIERFESNEDEGTKTLSHTQNNTQQNQATAENFCLSTQPCSLQMFESLHERNKLDAFMGIIDQFTDDNHILLLMFTTLKCAHLSKSSSAALDLAMDMFKASFDYATKKNLEKHVLEYYLIQLGLLKSTIDFKPLYDFKSCRYALRETMLNRSISSEIIREGLKAFQEELDA